MTTPTDKAQSVTGKRAILIANKKEPHVKSGPGAMGGYCGTPGGKSLKSLELTKAP